MAVLSRVGLAGTLLGLSWMVATPATAAPVVLGSFVFDSALFGDSLLESDGGTYSASNWLNVVNANPGNPGFLTGANFSTGIANIGFSGTPTYTIGYGTGILNGAGADLGVVTARFSVIDSIGLTINGQSQSFGPAAGVNTLVDASFFFGGGGLFRATYFVTPVDLSDFGVALGDSVSSITVTGSPQLDLIRVAGFTPAAVDAPEPASLALLGFGLAGLAAARRRR